MVRDLGARRQPPAVLAIGSGLIFLALCYLLHRRDRVLKDNLEQPLPAIAAEPPPDDATADAEQEKVGAGV
jgi:hypothetical protein